MSNGNQSMKALIEAINKLQEVFSSAGLALDKFHLPQIAVVGGQSAGKSSVLENFVGRDFLPRGSDIVTRCPLLVQLIPSNEEYAVFSHLEGQTFKSFHDVRDEIEKRTDDLTAGKKKGISDQAIILRIYSPHVVDLTLVDLPGLTKVPVGDQPEDIGEQIKQLALKYVTNENTLILAVSPANNDIANSDALQLAKEVDPDGKRTFGVITKLDLMDAGTDARKILRNLVYPLQRGYIGIVNRSQMDINNKKDIKEAQNSEMEFFKKEKAYRDMAERMGSKYLQHLLSKSLAEHILKKMPDLKDSLRKQREETKKQLENFTDYDGTEQMARRIIHDFLLAFNTQSDKSINGNSLDFSRTEVSTGAQIIQCFSLEFSCILAREHTAFKKEELKRMIANIRGLRYGQFVPEEAVECCIKRLVEIYKEPSSDCVEKVGDLLREMVVKLCEDMQSFPKLEEKVKDLCYDKILDFENYTKEIIRIFIESQGSFINTRHPDFKSIASVEDIPLEYYKEIDECWGKNSSNTLIPTFFPSVNLKATEKNKIIMESSAFVKKDGELIGQFQLLLSSHYLAFYVDQGNLHIFKGKVKTSLLEIEDDGSPVQLKLTTSGRALPTGGQEIELKFINQGEKQHWMSSLKRTHSQVTTSETSKPTHSDEEEEEEEAKDILESKTSKKMKADKNLQEQLEIIAYMVDNYMKITHKAIADMLPKFIRNLLVDKLIDYIKRNLNADLEEMQQELLEVSPEELQKKAELKEVYKATEKALSTLTTVSNEFQKIR